MVCHVAVTEEFLTMPEIKEGQRVVPSVRTKNNASMMDQLRRRTSLSEEELCSGSIRVRAMDEKGHAVLVHPNLNEPFSCHLKFLEPAPQA